MTKGKVKLSEFKKLPDDKDFILCRYMDLEYFIRMLKTETLYAKRKRCYEDPFEKHIPMDSPIFMKPNGGNTSPQPRMDERKKEAINEYEKWAVMPTSCWTLDKENNYLMWKSYAPNGIRIASTFNLFVSAICSDSNFSRDTCTLHYGSMEYGRFSKTVQSAFWKDIAYRGEHEFRFYFELEGDNCDTRECNGENGICIPMNMGLLIKSVQISPFVNYTTAKEIERIFKCHYGIQHISPVKIR